MPLPAPCARARPGAATAPSSASPAAPAGCIRVAIRVVTSGSTRRRTVNSRNRTDTAARPSSPAAAVAWAMLRPKACRRRGRWALMQVETNQAQANSTAICTIGRSQRSSAGDAAAG